MNIAVIGAGLAGLTAAWALSRQHQVTLYERHARPGFIAHALAMPCPDGGEQEVDVPLRVFYPGYYRTLMRLYAHIGAATEPISYAATYTDGAGQRLFRYQNWRFGDRSFSVLPPQDLRHAHTRSVVAGTVAFLRRSGQAWRSGRLQGLSLREHIQQERYPQAFVDTVLLPAISTVCTCPNEAALEFPAELVAEYFGRGLAHQSVRRAVHGAQDAATRLLAPVQKFVPKAQVAAVLPRAEGVSIVHADGSRSEHEHVVLASSAAHALALLGDAASAEERRLLGAVQHHAVEVLLHRDPRLMPQRRSDWSPINSAIDPAWPQAATTIWINAVQPRLRSAPDLFQTVAPGLRPRDELTISSARFDRPVVNAQSLSLLPRLQQLHAQPQRRLWFCGSYARVGIPLLEAAVASALDVAERIAAGAALALNKA
jgi:uncharacterized protein